MSLIKCKNCNGDISSSAKVCPHCGQNVTITKFCPECGSEVQNGSFSCASCGKVLGQNVSNGKSKIAAGLLGILIGAFGVHNFYLGYTSKAVAQLLMTVLSCGVLSFVSGIWGLIEGIMILTGSINTDADGNPLTN